MVKTVLGVNHQGLRDWFIQRVSAIVMAIYSLVLIIWILAQPSVNYLNWHWLFSHVWMKVATMLFAASVLLHAWVGIWTIFTDYIKIAWLCLLLNTLVFFTLAASFFWTLFILWGI